MKSSRRKAISFLTAFAWVLAIFLAGRAADAASGEELFREHCSACHPGGKNIVNPKKTLYGKDREANNIKTAEDIVNKIRNPGPSPTHPEEWAGMKRFDRKTIPDDDAVRIADYILKAFP